MAIIRTSSKKLSARSLRMLGLREQPVPVKGMMVQTKSSDSYEEANKIARLKMIALFFEAINVNESGGKQRLFSTFSRKANSEELIKVMKAMPLNTKIPFENALIELREILTNSKNDFNSYLRAFKKVFNKSK